MSPIEAKRVLSACRAGHAGLQDPAAVEALALVHRDPALTEWWAQQQAFHESVKHAFRSAPVPPHLRQRLLVRNRDRSRIVPLRPWWQKVGWATAAAAAILLLAIVGPFRHRPAASESFETFRDRMSRSVLRQYRMDVVTSDMTEVRGYLDRRHAPADYTLPPGLTTLPVLGAGILSWQGEQVSMVCLNSRNSGTLFLFIVNQAAVRPPPGPAPEYKRVSKLVTASWSQGGRSYVLAGTGSPEELRQYF